MGDAKFTSQSDSENAIIENSTMQAFIVETNDYWDGLTWKSIGPLEMKYIISKEMK